MQVQAHIGARRRRSGESLSDRDGAKPRHLAGELVEELTRGEGGGELDQGAEPWLAALALDPSRPSATKCLY